MPIDEAFLEILACPATRRKLRILDAGSLERLNAGLKSGSTGGRGAGSPIEAGLVTDDRTRVYPVRNGIPVLLEEECIRMR